MQWQTYMSSLIYIYNCTYSHKQLPHISPLIYSYTLLHSHIKHALTKMSSHIIHRCTYMCVCVCVCVWSITCIHYSHEPDPHKKRKEGLVHETMHSNTCTCIVSYIPHHKQYKQVVGPPFCPACRPVTTQCTMKDWYEIFII